MFLILDVDLSGNACTVVLEQAVQRLDIAIQRMNHYSSNTYYQNLLSYPVCSGLSNGQCYPPSEQLEPGT